MTEPPKHPSSKKNRSDSDESSKTSPQASKKKASKRESLKNVFEYLDYRAFLRDYYLYQKERSYGFSYRVFARRAGFRSSNFAQLVINGRRNLSSEGAIGFAEACELEGRERDYFCDLVTHNQAESPIEKERSFRRLTGHARFRKVHALTHAQAEYFSNWYVVAIRELCAHPQFREDPAWIAGCLQPPIKPSEAKRALQVLERLGMVERTSEGMLRTTDSLVSTDGPLGSHLAGFHREMLERAAQAIEQVPREERDLSALTVCVSQARLRELMHEVRAFRKRLLQLAEEDDRPERVVHLGFQVFPLSQAIGSGPASTEAPTKVHDAPPTNNQMSEENREGSKKRNENEDETK